MKVPKLDYRKFKTGQQVWILGYIGPSGITEDGGVFVNVNTDDPEIWVHLDNVRVATEGK